MGKHLDYANHLRLSQSEVPIDFLPGTGLLGTAAAFARQKAGLAPEWKTYYIYDYTDGPPSFTIDVSWSSRAQAYQMAYINHHKQFYPEQYL
jgi:hypothetical protein